MKPLLTFALLLFSLPAFASAPVCMYQDMLSGQATGGASGAGVEVSVFGTGFGSTIGSISGTVNGTAITNFIYLGADKTGNRQQLGFQIPAGATGSGNISITFPGGPVSTCGTFTVRTGAIYFVGSGIDNATTGVTKSCTTLKNGTALDGNAGSGTYASPWKVTNVSSTQINGGGSNVPVPTNALTPSDYYGCLNTGDTLIFLNGFSYPYADPGGLYTALALHDGYTGTSAAPTTLIARPGATTLLGGPNVSSGIRDYSDVGLVIAGLTIRGQGNSIAFTEPSTGPFMRIVNVDASAPTEYGSTGNITGGQEAQVSVGTFILGIYSHGSGCADSGGVTNKQAHSVYTTGNQVEFGWSKIDDCTFNGYQWNYYTDNTIGFGLGTVHDNDITDVSGAGINLATVDLSQGAISVYNNIVHHVGLAPASDGDGGHSCLTFPGEAPSAPGGGTLNVYNNTFYDCSNYANTSNSSYICAISYGFQTAQSAFTVALKNNIIYQPAYTYTSSYNVFFCPLTGSLGNATLTGSNNIFYYGGSPSGTTPASSLTAITVPTNPLFINATNGPWTNYGLQAGSPAIGAGTATLYPTRDFAGTAYSNPPAIGALMLFAAPAFLSGATFSGGTIN